MKLYYKTSEAAEILGVENHTIRYYEKEFKLNFARSGRDRQITTKQIEFLRQIIDEKAKLPMFGSIGSLNVSVACGAFLYETVRQRG